MYAAICETSKKEIILALGLGRFSEWWKKYKPKEEVNRCCQCLGDFHNCGRSPGGKKVVVEFDL